MRSDLKEFTYNDLLQHDKNRVSYIHTLNKRSIEYYLYLKYLVKKNKPINPEEILLRFSQIDFKNPIVLSDIKGN